jgi:hypothetical protein
LVVVRDPAQQLVAQERARLAQWHGSEPTPAAYHARTSTSAGQLSIPMSVSVPMICRKIAHATS